MSRGRTVGQFLVLSCLWGSAFVVVKAGQQYFPSVFYAGLCFDVTGVGLLAYVVARDGQWRPESRDSWVAVAVISLFTITVYNALFYLGQRGAPSAVGAVLLSFIPVLTAAFTRVFLPGRRFAVLEVVGLVLGLVGVGLVVRPTPAALATGDVSRLLIFLAAVSNALGAVFVQRADPSASTPVLLAWAIPPAGLALHAVSLFVLGENPATATVTVEALLAVGYLAFLGNLAGYALYFDLLRRLGAFEVNLVNYLQPIVAAVVGWLVLGEGIEVATVGGFVTIVVGFLLVKHERVAETGRRLLDA